MVEFTAFGLSVIVSGTIFIGLMLWFWSKKDITLQKKGQITLFLLAGLAGVIYASFAFALISLDNASYYSEGRNLGSVDHDRVIANARQAGYVIDGPNYIHSELHEAAGIWSPNVSQVRSYLGDSFWVLSANYYFPEGLFMEVRFENGTTTISFFNETRQDPSHTDPGMEQLPDEEIITDHFKAVFGASDAEAQAYLALLKESIESDNGATITVSRSPDFNSSYTDMKNISDRFSFTETTGTGLTRQVFYEDDRTVGSIAYVIQNSRVIYRESGTEYIVQVDPKGGVNLQVRLSAGTEIPEDNYRSVFRKMFSDMGLDPGEVANFEFEYAPSGWP